MVSKFTFICIKTAPRSGRARRGKHCALAVVLILFFQRLSVSASQRVVTAFGLCAGALVCLRGVLCGGERVRA